MAFLDHILQTADMLKKDIEHKRQFKQQQMLRQQQFMTTLERQRMANEAAQERQTGEQNFKARQSYFEGMLKDKNLKPESRSEILKAQLDVLKNPDAAIPALNPQRDTMQLPPEVVRAFDGVVPEQVTPDKYKIVMGAYDQLKGREERSRLNSSTINKNQAQAYRARKLADKPDKPKESTTKNQSLNILNILGQGASRERETNPEEYKSYMSQLDKERLALQRGANPDSMLNVVNSIPSFQDKILNQQKQADHQARKDSLSTAIMDLKELFDKEK